MRNRSENRLKVSNGRRVGRVGAVIVGVAALALVEGCTVLDRLLDPVEPGEPRIDDAGIDHRFHQELFVADLHADTLASDRDFFASGARVGHVDLERLQAGNVALQLFTVFTDTPFPRENGCVSGDDINFAALLQFAQFRPPATWFSPKARALHQANKLDGLATESKEKAKETAERAQLMVIKSAPDLETLLKRQREGPVIGGLLGLEGAHALEDDIGALDEFFTEGFRMIALTHRFDNAFAGASEGCSSETGLTPLGRDLVAATASRRMIIDLAHASSKTIREVSEIALRDGYPVLISHGGIRGTCGPRDSAAVSRNITDDDARAVALTGGIVGIGFWPEAVCWEDIEDFDQARRVEKIVDAMDAVLNALSEPSFVREMARLRGRWDPAEHVAFGSDYDGAVAVPFHVGDLHLLTSAMRRYRGADGRRRFSDDDIRNIAGLNVCRLLATRLPDGNPALARRVCDQSTDEAS